MRVTANSCVRVYELIRRSIGDKKHGGLKYEESCEKREVREKNGRKVSIGSAVRIAFSQPRMSPPIVDLTGSCVVTVKAIGSSVRFARNGKAIFGSPDCMNPHRISSETTRSGRRSPYIRNKGVLSKISSTFRVDAFEARHGGDSMSQLERRSLRGTDIVNSPYIRVSV